MLLPKKTVLKNATPQQEKRRSCVSPSPRLSFKIFPAHRQTALGKACSLHRCRRLDIRTHPSRGVSTRRLLQQPQSCVGHHPISWPTGDGTEQHPDACVTLSLVRADVGYRCQSWHTRRPKLAAAGHSVVVSTSLR
jgi:hypothetical protein